MLPIDHAIYIKTVFCDIDGCIVFHCGSAPNISTHSFHHTDLLPGVKEVFRQWCDKGYTVVLTTGRPESLRDVTIQQIRYHGLYYHHLIMGLPRGQRVVINDMKEGRTEKTAACVNLVRNRGMSDVDI